MKFPFVRPVSGPNRPIVPFSFADLPRVTLLGLVDSGSLGVRLDAQFAEPLGVDLSQLEQHSFSAGGQHYVERLANVPLRIGTRGYSWDAEVSFVHGWGHSFQLLGFRGFFDQFVVQVDARKEQVLLRPHRTT
ncbi:hypothetical protein DEI93_16005 [Curtobacterium sp. MCBD17_035]|jgi:hypothetical protein|uniref:hypothetical protein n=1 Tax=Curtobacterium sp. MCBD17_035 TaxID=2175673 RepID=UPI000DA9F2C7|nr:hypothetical protein [Curtobacterium sp. MCBD17_035]WIB67433.1 hypothetical protein DEI93_16005 [Curtobacterium sp. MCBD17_035]